jgi:CHASE2 domain-containing sensor protein
MNGQTSSNKQPPASKRLLKLGLRWVIYLVLALLLLHEATGNGEIEECSGIDASAASMSRQDYRTLVQYAIPDTAQAEKVVLVTIGSMEPDDVRRDFCQQRFFVARLIHRLKRLNVAVIALDKFYEPDTCPADGEETKALLSAVSGIAPVVTLAARTALIPKSKRGETHVCLSAKPGFDLGLPKRSLGLTRLDADTRRIPLQWPTLSNGVVTSEETFAFVTAKAFNKDAMRNSLLTTAITKAQQPFSTMVRIEHHSALEILCGTKTDQESWKTCYTDEPVERMNGAVVVIGDHYGEQDLHPSIGDVGNEPPAVEDDTAPEGLVYGVDLQANYIAALLDRRYYLPLLPEWGDQAFVIGFFIVLQVLCWRLHRRLWLAGVIGVALWGSIALASFGVLAFTRYLLTVWVHEINLGTVVVSVLEHWVARMD